MCINILMELEEFDRWKKKEEDDVLEGKGLRFERSEWLRRPSLWQVRVLVVGDSGVVFVHDLSQRRIKTGLQKWAAEVAATGTFSAPLGSIGPGELPVPYLVIGDKADVAAKEGIRGSSGNLVDAARQWVEKQGLISSSEELPLTVSFPGSTGLVCGHFLTDSSLTRVHMSRLASPSLVGMRSSQSSPPRPG